MDGLKVTLGNIGAMPRQMNNGIAFLLVLRGTIGLEHNGKTFALQENDVVVLEQGDLFALSSQKNNVVLFIHMSGEYTSNHLPNSLINTIQCNSRSLNDNNDHLYAPIKRNVARMAFIHFKQETGYELLLQSVLFETLYLLSRDFSAGPSQAQIKDTTSDRLQASLVYIHQNYKTRISLENAAGREFMSVQYLSRLFQEQLGTTFMQYVNALRLSGAERELIFTKDTVTRIALNNGFASAKALNEQFIKKHGCSPAQYRNAYKMTDTASPVSNIQLMDSHDNDSLEALARFIQNHNVEQIDNVQAHYAINLANAPQSPLPHFHSIVEIGDLSMALRADVRKQLEETRQKLHLSGVSFGGFFRMIHATEKSPSLFQTYDLYEILNFFHRLDLTPLIRIETQEMRLFKSPEECLRILREFLHLLQMRYTYSVLKHWRFEVIDDCTMPNRYTEIYAVIKSVNRDIQVGLRIDPYVSPENRGLLQQMTVGARPDFFGFTFEPNEESRPTDPIEFETQFRNYHIRAIESVRRCLVDTGYPNSPLYLMRWNVLTGKTLVEAGEFHRTALMADVLCALMGKIEVATVQLSIHTEKPFDSGLPTRPLSLFVGKDIRRPLFFIAKAIKRLKPMIVWRSEHGLMTTDGEDRYALFVYNACYIDPFRALDNIRLKGNMLNCSIALQGLTPGRYRIKEYLMDKDKGSLYQNSIKLDLSVPPDEEDWDEYVHNICNPSIALWEAHSQDGALKIQTELAINAAALYIIKHFA